MNGSSRRHLLALVLSAVLTLALLGCGADPVSPEPTRPIEPGWTRYEKADYNFTIDIPAGWKEISMEPAEVRARIASLEEEGFEFSEEYQEELVELSLTQLSFFAFDPTQASFEGANTVVYVQRIRHPPYYPFNFLEQRLERVKAQGYTTAYLEGNNILYPTRDTAGQFVTGSIDYHIFGKKQSYVISAAGLELSPEYRAICDKIVASIHTIEED